MHMIISRKDRSMASDSGIYVGIALEQPKRVVITGFTQW